MHSTSGVCVCGLASNGANLYGMMITEANEATQTHCYNPVTPAYPIWAYYAHGRQHRCQEDPVSLPSGRLEKTTRSSSPHHVAQHRPTGYETSPPYAPRSSRFGSEPPSVEDDVDVWHYAIVSCMPETTMTSRETSKALKHGSHSFTCKLRHACLYLVSIHQMALPLTGDGIHLIAAYYSSVDSKRMKG